MIGSQLRRRCDARLALPIHGLHESGLFFGERAAPISGADLKFQSRGCSIVSYVQNMLPVLHTQWGGVEKVRVRRTAIETSDPSHPYASPSFAFPTYIF